jgi:hypothetical protein
MMNINNATRRGCAWLAALCVTILAACGGGDPTTTSLPEVMQPTTVIGADGASMDFTPAEGLLPATLSITRAGADAPALPPGMERAGAVYQFAPQRYIGNEIEIRVPFDRAQASGAPRLLVALAGEDSWTEVEAQIEGTMLRARVPALGYAVAVRPLSVAGAERMTASATQPAQTLRGQLSAEPALQGSGFLRLATAPSTATIRLDYSFAQSCAAPVQLRLRALVARSPSPSQPIGLRTVDLGSRALSARAGSESFELPLTAAANGTWVFLADARCVEQGRVRFGVLAALPVLVVKIVNAPPPPAVGSATLGAAGGTVDGPDGVRLVVPANALETDVTFRIARDATGAPPLEGLNAVSPIYAVTPHGQAFGAQSVLSIPLAAATQLPAGETPLLLKAEPGGVWRIVARGGSDPARVAADIDGLSFFVLAACTSTSPQWTVFPPQCPANHQLRLTMFDGQNQPVESLRNPDGVLFPLWTVVDVPQTRTFRVDWTRPAGINRVDGVSVSGLPNGFSDLAGFTSDFPRTGVEANGNLSRNFNVTIDPTRVPGAAGVNGTIRRVKAAVGYSAEVFQLGVGPVRAGWVFEVDIPIEVRFRGTPPTISTPPANIGVVEGQPATFNVVATVSPAAPLAYRWFRRPDANGTFAPITGATQASYTLSPTTLTDNGAQFQVEVCVQGTTRCVTSPPATLTVTRAPVVPSFTMQPASLAVSAGQTASFTAVATGVPAPLIRWQSAADGSSTFSDITTAGCTETLPAASGDSTAATCTVGPVAIGDSGRRYRALAINAAAAPGVPSTEATLTVTPAPTAPAITTQPAPQSTTAGGSATFSVVATGTAPLAFTWRINGTALPASGGFTIGACTGTVSASGASLTLTSLSAGCNGTTVTVVVSNGINPDATSNGASLTVAPAGGPGLALLAGAIGGPGTVDGTGSEARVQFGSSSIAVDAAGTAYFSDSVAGRLRKVTAAGVVTTFADVLVAPAGVAVDGAGNAYVAERARHRILRFAADGSVSVWAGSGVPGALDGTGTQAQLTNPEYLSIDAGGNLYVTENAGFAPRIRRISATQQVTTFHDFGGADGVGAIAAAADGSIYGLGAGAFGNAVLRIAPGGIVSTVAGSPGEEGNVDGTGSAARFFGPVAIVFGGDGNLYVTDGNNLSVRRVTPAGEVTTVSGARQPPFVPTDGVGTAGRYEFPTAIGRAPNGDLLVGDVATMRRLTPAFVLTTFLGQRLATGTADGSGAAARFRAPLLGVALDAVGNALVADTDRIRVVTPAGATTTLLTPQPARVIVRDPSGGGFVVASYNAVWRISATGVATLLAGDPQFYDYVDAPVGTDARFGFIRGIAVDSGGNVFVAEAINQNATIRRITPTGAVTTWAGAKDAPPEIIDGDRLSARFSYLDGGLAIDRDGNLVVADFNPFTGAALLRRITPQGTVSTFVNGGALRPALSLALAADGSLLAGGDATLQRISSDGAVTTLVGTQSQRGVRLGIAPNLNLVYGLAVRPNGRVVLTSEAAVLELTLP